MTREQARPGAIVAGVAGRPEAGEVVAQHLDAVRVVRHELGERGVEPVLIGGGLLADETLRGRQLDALTQQLPGRRHGCGPRAPAQDTVIGRIRLSSWAGDAPHFPG